MFWSSFCCWERSQVTNFYFSESIEQIIPPTIQRFLLRLQRYNFQLNYVPRNQLFVVDMLSRLPLLDRISKIGSDEMNYFVQSVIKSFQIVSGSSTTNEKGNAKGRYITITCVTNSKWMIRSRYNKSQTIFDGKRFTYFIYIKG